MNAPIRTTDELQEALDVDLAAALDAIAARSELDPMTFTAHLSGFLIKTGVTLGVSGGCPRPVMEAELLRSVDDAFAPDLGYPNRAARRAAEARSRYRKGSP